MQTRAMALSSPQNCHTTASVPINRGSKYIPYLTKEYRKDDDDRHCDKHPNNKRKTVVLLLFCADGWLFVLVLVYFLAHDWFSSMISLNVMSNTQDGVLLAVQFGATEQTT